MAAILSRRDKLISIEGTIHRILSTNSYMSPYSDHMSSRIPAGPRDSGAGDLSWVDLHSKEKQISTPRAFQGLIAWYSFPL